MHNRVHSFRAILAGGRAAEQEDCRAQHGGTEAANGEHAVLLKLMKAACISTDPVRPEVVSACARTRGCRSRRRRDQLRRRLRRSAVT